MNAPGLDQGWPALHLPEPEQPFTRCQDAPDHDTDHTSGPVRVELGPPGIPPAPHEEGEHARYRWILGHQLSVCTWRLLCEHLTAAAAGSTGALTRCVLLYDTYATLVLYAGSCSVEVYTSVIRPWMMAADPAMSGTWARDHRRILAILATCEIRRDRQLRAALRRAASAHMTVAERLVPDSSSLLTESGRAPDETPPAADLATFDRFFGISYGHSCRGAFADQVWSRVGAALVDLTESPIRVSHPPEVARLQNRISELLCGLAVLATAFAVDPRHDLPRPIPNQSAGVA